MNTTKKQLLFLICLSFTACLPDTGGIEPPNDELVYPIGLRTTHTDDHLLVVNSNFDLRYNSGSLVALDLGILDNLDVDENGIAQNYACGDYNQAQIAANGELCVFEQKTVILKDETIRLGAFASDLELTPSGDRALIPVRGDKAIIIVDVDPTGGDLMSCNEDSEKMCDRLHRVVSNQNASLPMEPYQVDSMEYEDSNGIHTMGFATHLWTGDVSFFNIDTNGSISASLLKVAPNVIQGASGIAANRHKADSYNDIYVTGRHAAKPHVAILEAKPRKEETDDGTVFSFADEDTWFGKSKQIRLSGFSSDDPLYAAFDGRDIAVSKDGQYGYMITQSPDTLMKLDLNTYELLDMTTICKGPTAIQLLEYDNETSEPLDDKTYAFVMCFLTEQLFVVDTDLMQVQVRSTGKGPQDVAFDKTRNLAYVANFRESSISLFQARPPFNQVRDAEGRILKIGQTTLPTN